MKVIQIVSFLLLLVGNRVLFAQPNLEKPNLRQSNYFNYEQAVKEHQYLSELYDNKRSWKKRTKLIKQGILDGAEIANFKAGEKIKATIHSKKILNGYTVENVFFESISGIYVTGNLYKPINFKGKIPGILAPHGHGSDLRFGEATQQRCASMARMGAIVFAYDMIGYGDMKQCDHTISKALKIQLINSLRALDFIFQMPEVDTKRIAVSGESGGGTQTFLLAAIDQRVKFSVPVVMVSGYFFGGCVCESGMPIHVSANHATTNVEIAACIAPKPLLLVSDGDDWTKNNPDLEFPHIQRIYEFFNEKDKVENVHLPTEKHDYGPSKRKAAYVFLAKHVGLDLSKADETQNIYLTKDDLRVFNSAFPLPENAIQGNEAILAKLSEIK